MPTIGWTASLAGLVIIIVLGICFAALMSMWDRTHAPPHTVLRLVRCARYDRNARVEFIERVQTGLAIRTVQHCPLRSPGERCGEGCVWEPTAPETPT